MYEGGETESDSRVEAVHTLSVQVAGFLRTHVDEGVYHHLLPLLHQALWTSGGMRVDEE